MKSVLSTVALALGVAVASACSAKEVSVHDPVMAKEGDTYYLFSTGPGITFYSSPNMRTGSRKAASSRPAGVGQESGAELRRPYLGAGCPFP
jgi:hypothetical protein